MRSLLERVFQRAGVTFEQPRVVLVAARFSDVLLGAREELARSSIELVEARLLTDGGDHRLVVVRAGGGSHAGAPPAPDLAPLRAGAPEVAASATNGAKGHPIGRAANGARSENGGKSGHGTNGNGPRGVARVAAPIEPIANANAVRGDGLVDELKRKLKRISDQIEEESLGNATRFLYREQPLVTLEQEEGRLVALLGEGDEAPRPLDDRGALHAVLDEVVRLFFVRTRQEAQAPRGAAASAPR